MPCMQSSHYHNRGQFVGKLKSPRMRTGESGDAHSILWTHTAMATDASVTLPDGGMQTTNRDNCSSTFALYSREMSPVPLMLFSIGLILLTT